MIRSRKEACDILGVSYLADKETIKSAYKTKIKIYHPDAGASADRGQYQNLTEAYEYLSRENSTTIISGKIMGGGSNYYQKQAERDAAERRYLRQKEAQAKARRQELSQRRKEEEDRQKKYEQAMQAIDAVLAAEAIKTLISAHSSQDK